MGGRRGVAPKAHDSAKSSTMPPTQSTALPSTEAHPVASSSSERGKTLVKGKHPGCSDAEKRERDARTLFVGNVPLDWDKKRLRKALQSAVGEKYAGAFRPIWFRSEPLEEGLYACMRKVGSIKGAYSKHG